MSLSMHARLYGIHYSDTWIICQSVALLILTSILSMILHAHPLRALTLPMHLSQRKAIDSMLVTSWNNLCSCIIVLSLML